MSRQPLRVGTVLTLALVLTGASCEEEADEPPADCDERVGGDAKGTWSIHAEGRRRGCADVELDGELELDVSSFLVNGKPVPTSDGTPGDAQFEADAFVERIRRAQYTLEAGLDAPPGIEFSGTVNTCQVSFVLREQLPNRQQHQYTFHGFVDGLYRIYGEFEGVGPGSCRSRGEFEVEIR